MWRSLRMSATAKVSWPLRFTSRRAASMLASRAHRKGLFRPSGQAHHVPSQLCQEILLHHGDHRFVLDDQNATRHGQLPPLMQPRLPVRPPLRGKRSRVPPCIGGEQCAQDGQRPQPLWVPIALSSSRKRSAIMQCSPALCSPAAPSRMSIPMVASARCSATGTSTQANRPSANCEICTHATASFRWTQRYT